MCATLVQGGPAAPRQVWSRQRAQLSDLRCERRVVGVERQRTGIGLDREPRVDVAEVLVGRRIVRVAAHGALERDARLVELTLPSVEHREIVVKARPTRMVLVEERKDRDRLGMALRVGEQHAWRKRSCGSFGFVARGLVDHRHRLDRQASLLQSRDLRDLVGARRRGACEAPRGERGRGPGSLIRFMRSLRGHWGRRATTRAGAAAILIPLCSALAAVRHGGCGDVGGPSRSWRAGWAPASRRALRVRAGTWPTMSLRIHNTLSRATEPFAPIEPGHVRMYVCGITIYDYCHVGHARFLMAFDVVSRWLRTRVPRDLRAQHHRHRRQDHSPGARGRGIPIRQLTAEMTQAMHEDAVLGIEPPTFEPRATEHVGGMLSMIATLEDKGLAYRGADGDVNFSVRKFPATASLSGKSLDQLRAGERVAVLGGKQDPLDFVLWKAAKAASPRTPSGTARSAAGARAGTSNARR